MHRPDIDIDIPQHLDIASIFPVTRASQVRNNELTPHPCGYYFENIPVDHETGLAAIPYTDAGHFSYFKVDFLNNTSYNAFTSRREMEELIGTSPDWRLLESRDSISKLAQIGNHPQIVFTIKPTSILMLSDVLALIRPGKRHLLTAYSTGRIERSALYEHTSEQFSYKKAHAIAYAHAIVLQMHLLSLGRL